MMKIVVKHFLENDLNLPFLGFKGFNKECVEYRIVEVAVRDK